MAFLDKDQTWHLPDTETKGISNPVSHYTSGMTEDDLMLEQAAKVGKQVGECLRYFAVLRERMEETHWEPRDRLYMIVKETYDKLDHLNSRLHYLCMPSGVSRPRRKQ